MATPISVSAIDVTPEAEHATSAESSSSLMAADAAAAAAELIALHTSFDSLQVDTAHTRSALAIDSGLLPPQPQRVSSSTHTVVVSRLSLLDTIAMVSPLLSRYLHEVELFTLQTVSRRMRSLLVTDMRHGRAIQINRDRELREEIRDNLTRAQAARARLTAADTEKLDRELIEQFELVGRLQLSKVYRVSDMPVCGEALLVEVRRLVDRGARLERDDNELGPYNLAERITRCLAHHVVFEPSRAEIYPMIRDDEWYRTLEIVGQIIRLLLLSNSTLWKNKSYIDNGGGNVLEILIPTIMTGRDAGHNSLMPGHVDMKLMRLVDEVFTWITQLFHLMPAARGPIQFHYSEPLLSGAGILFDHCIDCLNAPTAVECEQAAEQIEWKQMRWNTLRRCIGTHSTMDAPSQLHSHAPDGSSSTSTSAADIGAVAAIDNAAIDEEHYRRWDMKYDAVHYLRALPFHRTDLLTLLFTSRKCQARFRAAIVRLGRGDRELDRLLNPFCADSAGRKRLRTVIENGSLMQLLDLRDGIDESTTSDMLPSLLPGRRGHPKDILADAKSRRIFSQLFFQLIRRKERVLLQAVIRFIRPFPSSSLLESCSCLSPLHFLCSTLVSGRRERIFELLMTEAVRHAGGNVRTLLHQVDGAGGGTTLAQMLTTKRNRALLSFVQEKYGDAN
jgi:hypothetical protein